VSRKRTGIWLAALLVTCGVVYGWWAANARPMFDEATFVRRAYIGPWRNTTYEERFYSIDLPAFPRWVWKGVFAVTGWHWEEMDDAHYVFDERSPIYPRNLFPEGPTAETVDAAPRGAVHIMRAVNAAFMAAACVAAFLLGLYVFRTPLAGAAAALPFLVHPGVGQWAVGYPGTDAMLLLWLVAFLALWTVYHMRGTADRPREVLFLAVVAGLGAATKINAGLLTVAFAVYTIAFGAKGRKWWLGPAFCAAAFAVFVIVNPVLWQPGAGGLVEGMRDVFARRQAVMEEQNRYLSVAAPSAYFVARAWLAPVAAVAAWAAYRARDEKWLAPAAIWGAVVAAGSYVLLNRYDLRLALPIDFALMMPAVLALTALFVRPGTARTGNGSQQDDKPREAV
jgi:hypothetical protein